VKRRAYQFLVGLLVGCMLLSPALADEPWRDSNFAKRIKVTLDDTAIGGDESDFPVLLNVDGSSEARGQIASGDITEDKWVVYDGDGNKCAWEKESYTDNKDASGYCAFNIWCVTDIYNTPAGTQNQLWFYYDNLATSDNEPTDVWDANFVGVWHLAEASGHPQDSSGNAHHADAEVLSAYRAAGPAGFAVELDGANDYIRVPDHADFDLSAMTIEAWYEPDSTDANRIVIQQWSGVNFADIYILKQNSTGSGVWEFGATGDGTDIDLSVSAGAPSGNWEHIAGTIDGSWNGVLYVDGVAEADTSTAGGECASTSDVYFGCRCHDLALKYDGLMAEIRISNTNRSAAWIGATHTNVATPASFYSWSAEESKPAGGTIVPLLHHYDQQRTQ